MGKKRSPEPFTVQVSIEPTGPIEQAIANSRFDP